MVNEEKPKVKKKSITILCDTREGLPLNAFKEDYEVCGLNIGDYSCKMKDGTIVPLVFERKELSDLFGTMTSGYRRFEEECERAKAKGISIIIILEVPYGVVKQGHKYSNTDGKKILKTLETLWLKYKIDTWFCANRFEMAERIENMFLAVQRRYDKKGKKCFWDEEKMS